jgi:protein tyrosine/serine phosphatase
MPRILQALLTLVVVTALIGGPWAYFQYNERFARNFHVVEKGVLYRSGQLPLPGFQRIVHDHGIRTVICLRDGDQDTDQAEEAYCKRWGLTHVRIPPRSWYPTHRSGPAPVEKGLAVFREVMNDPSNHPVLIHCFAGLHRTGAYCAVYRMDYQGWKNADALAEMRAIGYTTLENDRDLFAFLSNYRGQSQNVFRPASRQK